MVSALLWAWVSLAWAWVKGLGDELGVGLLSVGFK